MIIDTHCHILKESYNDIDSIVKKCLDNNVSILINAGYNYSSSIEVLSLIDKYSSMYGVVGLHPENVLEDFDYNIFNFLPKKIVGIGEIGLDYHYTKDTKDKQIEVFNRQLDIAEELNLPVVIHSRDAVMDTIEILKKHNNYGVIHSFSGSLEVAREYIKLGFKLGINGVITFKNCKLKGILKDIGIENIVLETDSPYLTPVPFRGEQNNPSRIVETAKFVAEVYGISLKKLEDITTKNALSVFNIK